jgi:hypothetical protein
MGEQRKILEHVTDAAPGNGKMNPLFRVEENGVVGHNAPRIRANHAGDAVEDGGFACTRRSEENGEARGRIECDVEGGSFP